MSIIYKSSIHLSSPIITYHHLSSPIITYCHLSSITFHLSSNIHLHCFKNFFINILITLASPRGAFAPKNGLWWLSFDQLYSWRPLNHSVCLTANVWYVIWFQTVYILYGFQEYTLSLKIAFVYCFLHSCIVRRW